MVSAVEKDRADRRSIRPIDLTNPDLYINQELGRLDFLSRVLDQVSDDRHPLLEKVKFLAIFAEGLDDFFSIRVSGIKENMQSGMMHRGGDALTPQQQLSKIRERVLFLLRSATSRLYDQLLPALAAEGIRIVQRDEVKPRSHAVLDEYFAAEVFPVLTPLAVDPGHPFPHISNFSLNLAVILRDDKKVEHFARIKVPDVLPRLIPLGGLKVVGKSSSGQRERSTFVWLEQLIAANLNSLFPGMEVVDSHPFRVIRDADLDIQADEADDLSASVEQSLRQRRFGEAVQLVVEPGMPSRVLSLLRSNLKLGPEDIYESKGPLGLADLFELTAIDRPDLKDPPFVPKISNELKQCEDFFLVFRETDVLLHHPFDSFSTTVDVIEAAARDPQVLAIKMALYRVGQHAPVVDALLDAAQHGKQVAVLVELTARGDERSNIDWARELERAGVHVAYGLLGLKTHGKVALIVRRDADGIRRYVHLGTGNYNATTARTYEDYGLWTSREDLAVDASELFNYLTGYSEQTAYRSMLVAPVGLRAALISCIREEVRAHKKNGHGKISIKVNSLTDAEMIRQLYHASQEGVRIDLLVRGSCSLRPGIPGVSETISVKSLVGRLLEHSRVYQFRHGGAWTIYLGSADLMPRNLDGRVEVLFPLEDEGLKGRVRREFEWAWKDNVNAWQLDADGSWHRVPVGTSGAFDSQAKMIQSSG